MRKTLATLTIAGTIALGGTLAAPASAALPPMPPNVGECANAPYNPVTYPHTWADLETQCGVTFTDSQRPFVSAIENLAQKYYDATLALRTQASAQQATITHQQLVIKRLRHRLASR